MGLLDGLMGNASEIDVNEIQEEFGPILGDSERVLAAYKIIRDLFVFTTGRLILVDKQGLTGKKVEYNSIPYKSITRFAVESAGHFDMDSELKIWISGHGDPVVRELKAGTDVVGVQKMLANSVLK
ncbi:PH domain-containing protein [Pseudodesulfovibrio tunisiensis]|uniref:PH domain-containing protein n=1 Tax=Pseudodesulfovibrio tunisiensis TaxID=463192 RepID=UPI001FB52D36|nr:PH domain-containing protein [Pseudodesulfovibrio tunisiensis]